MPRHGLGHEGIVSKRAGSRYVSGRARAWLKTKNPNLGRSYWRASEAGSTLLSSESRRIFEFGMGGTDRYDEVVWCDVVS